jgi:hypothetical protein
MGDARRRGTLEQRQRDAASRPQFDPTPRKRYSLFRDCLVGGCRVAFRVIEGAPIQWMCREHWAHVPEHVREDLVAASLMGPRSEVFRRVAHRAVAAALRLPDIGAVNQESTHDANEARASE